MESAQRAHQRRDFERAKLHLDQANQIAHAFPENDPRNYETLLALGMVNYDLGEHENALQQLGAASRGYGALGKQYDRLRASSLVGLALVNQRIGNHDKAEKNYMEAIDLMVASYGAEHLAVAQTGANLAGLYLMLGRYDEAIARLTRALAVLERDLGPNHPDSKTALQNMALAYRLSGNDDKADEIENRLSGQ
jgi:tetratricopeptide (TPR) repeat protein